MNGLVGVILSAGKGSRIDPFNAHYPKPLLPIGNRPIIGHHLERLKDLGCREAVLVVGHLMDHIINTYGRGDAAGIPIRYVEQDQTLGIAHAAGKAEPFVEGPMVLCLGDIFYLTTRLERLVERYRRGDVAAVLAVMEDRDPASMRKNFSVEVGVDGYVTRVVEKPRAPRSTLKGCGIYLFGPEIFDAIRKTPRTALRDEYEITTSIQILIDDGLKVAAEPVIDWDLNVTFPRDLLAGNLQWLRHVGAENLVAPGATVHPGATLRRTVVGEGVTIDAPATIEDSVILPRSAVNEDLKRAIVSREIVIRC
ncbi:MAG TPA: sugar phosphate nucleotidyltransferase [Planctomycetota bacterium]|nr:sugar phosphate nucleotidyltransferase [Planctomycetota bacterium]